jgi:predicted phage-related endonuclease
VIYYNHRGEITPNNMKEDTAMANVEIVSKIESLKEWEALAAEAAAEIESLKDAIKKEMDSRGVEELEAGQYIARFTTVLTNRFDTTAFKKAHGEMYQEFTKQTTSRRFSVN